MVDMAPAAGGLAAAPTARERERESRQSDRAQRSRRVRHPDRLLIETLNAERRERFKRAKREGQSDASYLASPRPQRVRDADRLRGEGSSSTAPAALQGDDSVVDALIDGMQARTENKPVHALSPDKAQKHRSGHVLVRLLSLGFIEPLCRVDDRGLPGAIDRTTYTVSDALHFMRNFLRENPGILEHTFSTQSAGASKTAAPLESTTFDMWVIPRLLSASAVLAARLDGALPSSRDVRGIYEALLDLTREVLDTSSAFKSHYSNVRIVLLECLRASLRALSAIGRPSFLNTSPPPLFLSPRQPLDADDIMILFFDPANDRTPAPKSLGHKSSGEGIARMWFVEDHTPFFLNWVATPTAEVQSSVAINLFLNACHTCLATCSGRQGIFADIETVACSLLHSNWQCELQLDHRLASTSQNGLNTSAAERRVRASVRTSILVQKERLSVLAARQLALMIGSSNEFPSAGLSNAYFDAVRAWREEWQHGERQHVEGVVTVMKPLSRTLADRVAKSGEAVETSGVQQSEEERSRRDEDARNRELLLEILLLILEADPNPRTVLDENVADSLIEVLQLDSPGEATPDEVTVPICLNAEKRATLFNLLRGRLRSDYMAENNVATTMEEKNMHECFILPEDLEYQITRIVKANNHQERDSDLSTKYFFCAAAGTLELTRTVQNDLDLHCSICDGAAEEAHPSRPAPDQRPQWRLDVLTRTLAAKRQHQWLSRSYFATLIRRALNHKPRVIKSLDGQGIAQYMQTALGLSQRSDRLIAARSVAELATWLYNASLFKGQEAFLSAEMGKLFGVLIVTLDGSRFKVKETALHALSALGSVNVHEVRQRAFLALVLQLGSDTFSKSLAYTIVTQLATSQRCTTFQLLSPHLDVIAVEVVGRMSKAPILFLEVLQLTKQNQSKFLQTTLQYTLPKLIQINDQKTLELVAKGIGSDVQTMCFNNAAPVLKSLLLQLPAARRDRSIHVFIESVRGDAAQDINVRSLIKAYSVELLGHLVSHLGNDALRKAALEGLRYMNTALNERQRSNKSASTRDASLSAFLKDEVLAILSWYNDELMDAHGKRSIAQKSVVTRSIGMMIHLIGQKIANVTSQLMATFNTTMQVQELMLPTLESWLALVNILRFEDLGPCVGPTVAALLTTWPRFGELEKSTANAILTHIIVDSPGELRTYLERDLPQLSSIKDDIPEVWEKIRTARFYTKHSPEQRLRNIVGRASNDNTSMCLHALLELRSFLQAEQSFVEAITSGNSFDPIVTRMVSVLFDAVSRDDDTVRDLSLEIMSMIGAVDPDRMAHFEHDSSRAMLYDFTDKEELTDFAVHLIKSLLVGAFKATNDTKHQAALAYAIQELLKFAGFSTALLPLREGQGARSTVVNLRTRQRWNSLVDCIDTLAPLLESKYSVQHGEPSVREKPLYAHSGTFKDWIQSWTNALILAAPGDLANDVFSIFRSVIRDHDLSIAQYILPHLVVDVVTLGSEEQFWEVHAEIVAVLEDQVHNASPYDSERRLLSAQVVFTILDHMSVWQRNRRRERQRTTRQKRDPVDKALGRVDQLMQAISQDLMAKASLKCRAFARSLLNFEQQIRTLRKEGAPVDQLQECFEDLHLIYANLEEPDGMEGVSTQVLLPSLDHQIREHESTGRWTSAQSCWEVKIQEKPDSLEFHVGLLRCLRNLGHYDTMRTHIRGVIAVHPTWRSPLNPFYVEGSCILSDWDEVRRSLSQTDTGNGLTSQHATARVMLAMHEKDEAAFQLSVREARALLGKPLVAARKSGYVSVYDDITQLHMLHELEMIGLTLGLPRQESRDSTVEMLSHRLSSRMESTLPSFRTREPLLSVRRSAFNTQRKPEFVEITAQSWVTSSKIARRAGHNQAAYSAALQASQWKAPLAIVQQAKLLASGEQKQAALQELSNTLRTIEAPPRSNSALVHSYANAHLFLARLWESSGRGRANEIIELYKKCTELDPHSEKMWYHLGHYYDQYMERELKYQGNVLVQHYNVCRNFLKSAVCGTKFFYRTVPRVLTIWLMYGDNEKFLGALRRNKSASGRQDPETDNNLKVYVKINELVHKYIERIAPYQWLAVLPQLISRVTHKNDLVWKTLRDLICHVLQNYPDQAMWTMIAGSQSKDKDRRSRVLDILNSIKTSAGQSKDKMYALRISTCVDQMLQIAKELLYLCDFPVAKDAKQLNMKTDFPQLLQIAQRKSLILPLQSSLSVTMPSNGKALSSHQVFDENLPHIIDMHHTIDVLSSLQRPRKIVVTASDGKEYAFLCKPKDDLRKDARLMEFDAMINNLLQSNSESRKRRLYIRTYSVVTLNEECGFIEWVPNTVGLRHILHSLYHARGIQLYTPQIKQDLDSARATPKSAGEIFESKVLSKFPPVFHEWFIAMFPEPSAWLEARLNYGRTLAVMSMVGHVLGLGDRHGENILFDSMTGDTVHVDLNCLFDKGTTFEIPERVPFRLTPNLVDALGVTGCEGVFRRAAEISMCILREHKDSLMSVLEAMVHDPLVEWGIDDRATKGRSGASMREDPRVVEARKSLDPVRAKLDGQLKRHALNDPFSSSANLSTNSLVDALIREATSSTNLALMYVGWGSYL